MPGIPGISHLFEHLMFRGTETRGPEEFSRLLQSRGGEINAFTTRDNTSYFENLPSEHLELGLQLEADRLLHLKLDNDTFAPELQVVISERKLGGAWTVPWVSWKRNCSPAPTPSTPTSGR